MTTFRSDEAGCEQWLREHPNSYGFNNFGGADISMNVLPRSGCRALHRPEDRRRRSSVPKICSTSYMDLLHDWARKVV